MGNPKVSTTGIIVLILASAATAVFPKNFPDISIITLLYLSLKYQSPTMLFWAFLSGLLHDGFNIDKIWISPVLFPIMTLSTNWAKDNFNLSFAPVRLFFVAIFIIISFGAYSLLWSITPAEFGPKFALSLLFAIIAAFLA